jgi:tetratricopeptide (TPR) repeat protein
MAEEIELKTEEGRRLVALDTEIGGMPFGKPELLTEEEAGRKCEALRFFREAYEAQMRGGLGEAEYLYKQSIEAYPTAEAYTFLGWAYSQMKRMDDAIEQCMIAIGVDPDFGNPYNDIGAYLIEKGDYFGAVEWLRRAMMASRYECYFYPHYNLGRVYEALGKQFDALGEYKAAVELNPGYALAVRAFRKLQGKLN